MAETIVRVESSSSPIALPSRPPDPCALVVFGVTGDLTRRKLVPALHALAQARELPERFALVGTSTSVGAAAELREKLRESTARFSRLQPFDEAAWGGFAGRIDAVQGDFNRPEAYAALRAKLEDAERRHGTGGNRLFYCAVPPAVYPVILRNLKQAGLLRAPGDGPWSRVVIEKPFGRDLASARELNRLLGEVLDEGQIFRIDHYLGKETVQNILVLRFGNSLFEPLWNHKYVDHVQITMAEEIGVEGRGKFYDQTGVLRDMIQSHVLQVLALCAMEPPVSFRADDIRDEKFKVLRALRPVAAGDTVRGRYLGYAREPGVAPGSRTPTYAALKLHVDNWRWQGVPFYIRSGKGLTKRRTEVSIHFSQIPFCLFGSEEVCARIEPNVLTLRIQPDEGIALRFGCKEPGDALSVGTVTMDFSYAASFKRPPGEAYERLLLDAMRGDATLFARRDADEQAWAFATPILESWDADPAPLPEYERGSVGPANADAWIHRDKRRWRPLA